MKPSRDQIDSLTGLRAIAAAWVMLMHFREITPSRVWNFPIFDTFIANGAYGVDVFFVLSGFILCHVYAKDFSSNIELSRVRQFMAYRFARIYPIHIVTFSMMLMLFVASRWIESASDVPSQRYNSITIITTLTLTHAWFPGIETPDMPAWSISAEWFAYILFPWLCFCMFSKKWVAASYAIFGLLLTGIEPIFHSSLIHVLSGFLVGMAAYQFIPVTFRVMTYPFTGLCAAIAIFLWANEREPQVAIGLILFAILITSLKNPRDWIGHILGLRGLVYLGEISYSLYMVHWPVRVIMRNGLQLLGVLDALPSAVIVGGYVAGTLIAAVLCYHFVELPGRTLLRKIGGGASSSRSRAGRPLGIENQALATPAPADLRRIVSRSAIMIDRLP